MIHRILVASYTDSLVTLAFDPEHRSLESLSSITVGKNPSWIIAHPRNRSTVYAALEQIDGRVVTLVFDDGGTLMGLRDGVSSGGQDPVSLAVVDDTLLVCNVRYLSRHCPFRV